MASLFVLFWSMQFYTGKFFTAYLNPMYWHAHEMLFGYALAVISGFLLTASHNWTGIEAVSGRRLQYLVGLWFLGRVGLLLPNLNYWFVAMIDACFLPLLIFHLKPYLFKGGQERNKKILYLLLILFLANIFIHLGAILGDNKLIQRGLYLGADTVILFILLISGRVLPFFKSKVLGVKTAQSPIYFNYIVVALLFVYVLSGLFGLQNIRSVSSLVISLFLLIWWLRTKPLDTIKVPILAVLFISYLWIIVGFAFTGLNYFFNLPSNLALHCFMVGGLGGFSLGMLTRVALGHTGNKIHATSTILFSYVSIFLAFIFRVVVPLISSSNYSFWILLAGVFWTLAFLLYLFDFTFLLLRPRVLSS